MRRFGLIGDPVRHSLSPHMHLAAFDALCLDAEYGLHRVPMRRSDRVERVMRDLAHTGGGNVTLPHKRAAAAALDEASIDVRLTGACNCFWIDRDGRLRGDNTDVGGLVALLGRMPGFDPVGAAVLVLGAGGAARAAVVAMARAGAAEIRIRNRSPERAVTLIAELAVSLTGGEASGCEPGGRTGPGPVLGPAAEGARATEFDLVIQATSLGLRATDPLPMDLTDGGPRFALDLVYGHRETRWTRHAREKGAEAMDGLPLLLEQGVLSLARWLDRPIPDRARDAMWEALLTSRR